MHRVLPLIATLALCSLACERKSPPPPAPAPAAAEQRAPAQEGPIVIGMSTLSARRFLVFNAVGAMIWAPLIAGIGYLFGHALEWLFADLKQYETIGLVGVVLVFIIVSGIVHVARGRRRGGSARRR